MSITTTIKNILLNIGLLVLIAFIGLLAKVTGLALIQKLGDGITGACK